MAVRGAASSPVFVGRAEEQATVRALVDGARAGGFGTLLIEGNAGVGKTELVRQVLDDLADEVVLVAGTCLPLSSTTVPYLPLRSAVARWSATADGTMSPEPPRLDGRETAADIPMEFDAWVSEVSRASPVVLVVDDLNWADPGTLDVLMYLLAGPTDRRLAVILTLRRGEVGEGHPLHRWLADVRRLPGFDVMSLEPLSREETGLQIAGVLGAPPHATLVDDVYTRTGGNAYLTRLLVGGLTPQTRRLPEDLPSDLEGALLASWHGLSESARELSKIVAMGRQRVAAARLAEVLGGDADVEEVSARLREAVVQGVFDVAADGTYWFHHPLQAQLLEAHVPADERRRWHERFAELLEERMPALDAADLDDVIGVADHHYEAGRWPAAYDWALRAADAASGPGNARARSRMLRRAIELRPLVTSDDAELALLERLWEATARTGDFELEQGAIGDLLAVTTDEEHPLLRAELIIRRGLLRFMTGEQFLEPSEFEDALRLTEPAPDSWQHALALAELAHASIWAARPDARDLAARALAAARAVGHPRALAFALTASAMVAASEGRDAEGVPLAQEARAAALEARDFWAVGHAISWEINCTGRNTSREGVALAERRRVEFQRYSPPHGYVAWHACNEAFGWVCLGEWQRAEEPLRVALGATTSGIADVRTRLVAARLAALQGRVDEAVGHLQRADELCGDISAFLALDSDVVRSEVLLATGDTEGALAAAIHGASLPGSPPTLAERLIPLAARCLADLVESARARHDDVGAVLARVDDLGERWPEVIADGPPSPESYRRQLDACTAWYAAEMGRARRRADAPSLWETAAALLDAADMPWDAAYAWFRAGEAHLDAGAGHRQAAAEALRTSHGQALGLRATPVLEAVEGLARTARVSLETVASPAESGADEGTGLPGLTARESEILGHLVAGRTYGEIARALVLSEKTVSSHVSNMLHKTGAANRVELARLALNSGPPSS